MMYRYFLNHSTTWHFTTTFNCPLISFARDKRQHHFKFKSYGYNRSNLDSVWKAGIDLRRIMRHPEKLWLFKARKIFCHKRSNQSKETGNRFFQETKEKATIPKFDCYHLKEIPAIYLRRQGFLILSIQCY